MKTEVYVTRRINKSTHNNLQEIMKKLAFLPLAALLLLASCSDDEEVITIPSAPVKVQQPVADNVNYKAPKQTNNSYTADGGTYVFSYENGQKIAYSMSTVNDQNVAIVKKIQGTASDVIIPLEVNATNNSGDTYTYTVAGIDLYHDAVAENVTSLTIPNTCAYYINQSALAPADNAHMRKLTQYAPTVQKIELQEGFPGYCSINGAIYTEDKTTLVTVPRSMKGEIAVAEGVQTIGDYAFSHCDKITAVTLPVTVAAIGKEAFAFMDSMLVLNITAAQAPAAYADTFGNYLGTNGELRIKKGSKGSYIVAKPTLKYPDAPVEPEEPGEDATDEDYTKYEAALEEYYNLLDKYNEELEAYNVAWANYDSKAGYEVFKTIKESL